MNNLAELKNKALSLTNKPGVYIMKNAKNKIIYVGKAKNLKNRVCSYFRNLASHTEKVQKMVDNVHDFDFIVTDSEFDALILECSLIKQNKPKYNVLLKDSKGFCFIKITTNSKFPQILVTQHKVDDGATYLGPYIQYSDLFPLKQAVKNINEIFMLPDCKTNFNGKFKKRPCLNYYIKKCMGVCCGKVSQSDYTKVLNDALDFLKNGSKSSVNNMKKQMQKASDELNFELAIQLRDRIKTIEKINKESKIYLKTKSSIEVISAVNLENLICFVILKYDNGRINGMQHFICDSTASLKEELEDFVANYYYNKHEDSYDIPKTVLIDCEDFDVDLFSKYLEKQFSTPIKIKLSSNGVKFKSLTDMAYSNAVEILTTHLKQGAGKFKLINELSKILHLEKTPLRIEAYDISNLGDSAIVGGMVVFQNGWPLNNNYRKFKMKTVYSQDDYASMKEMLKRRIDRFKEGNDLSFSKKPNLILIDGGKGHVLTIKKVLEDENFDIPCFGMVKNSNHRTRALTNGYCEIDLTSNNNLFYFITQIQDEVHRYTINYNRQLSEKEALELELTKIKGIGKTKAVKFLNCLSSVDNIAEMSNEQISKLLHINLNLADKIKETIQTML